MMFKNHMKYNWKKLEVLKLNNKIGSVETIMNQLSKPSNDHCL